MIHVVRIGPSGPVVVHRRVAYRLVFFGFFVGDNRMVFVAARRLLFLGYSLRPEGFLFSLASGGRVQERAVGLGVVGGLGLHIAVDIIGLHGLGSDQRLVLGVNEIRDVLVDHLSGSFVGDQLAFSFKVAVHFDLYQGVRVVSQGTSLVSYLFIGRRSERHTMALLERISEHEMAVSLEMFISVCNVYLVIVMIIPNVSLKPNESVKSE